MELEPAALGPYRLIEKIGAGGMGEVWKAEDTRLRRLVAIKILPHAVSDDAESKARLVREARTAAQLYHPNIATIHSIEEEGDRSFIVMEFVEGVSLGSMLHQGPLTESEVVRIAKQVSEALHEAHSKSIVHRDIKPDNIVVSGERVKVLDFGIAKQSGFQGATAVAGATGIVTEAGIILGTIQYMSPEQALGKVLDGRSDIFSLGVVMYQCLSGQLPFHGETVTETLTQIIRDTPRDITLLVPSLSPPIASVIRKCMAKNREERYAVARDVSRDLDLLLPTAATVRKPVIGINDAATMRTGDLPTELNARGLGGRSRPPWSWVAIPLAVVAGIGIASLYQHERTTSTRPATAAVVAKAPSIPSAATVVVVAPESTASVPTTQTLPPPKPVTHHPSAPVAEAVAPVSPPVVVPKPEKLEKPAAGDIHAEALAMYDRGMAAVRERRAFAAALAFSAAVEKDPELAAAWLKLGELSLRGGNRTEAERAYTRALRNPQSLSARDQELASIGLAASRGDVEGARQLIAQFEAAHPGDDEIKPYVRGLREIDGQPREQRGGGWRRRGHRSD